MSRKPYLEMTRRGQLKRIRRQMKLSHAYSSVSDNHSEEDVSFTCEEAVQAADENIVPSSFPHDPISPLIQEHCSISPLIQENCPSKKRFFSLSQICSHSKSCS